MMGVNKASCLLDSFSCVTGLPPQHLLAAVGHDGIFEGVPTGFHTQELIGPLIDKGFTVTPIELFPSARNEAGEQWLIEFDEGHHRRFCRYLLNGEGVLTGFNRKHEPHAVAWKNQQIFDSAQPEPYDLLCYSHSEPIGFLEGCPFRPLCFWKVSRVQG